MERKPREDLIFDWPTVPYCIGCRHYRAIDTHNEKNRGLVCHYLLDTGHRRPCKMGEGCTVKEVDDGEL